MPKTIKENQLNHYGISTQHEQMENGELRFRILSSDGSSYIRGENREKFVWGNSHSHEKLSEIMCLQSGLAVFVEYIDGNLKFTCLKSGEFFVTRNGIPHNHCFVKNTIIHTIKFGDDGKNDWVASPELDNLTKHLTLEQVLAKIK